MLDLATIIQISQLIGYSAIAVIFIVMIKADVKVVKVQIDGLVDNIKILNSSFDKVSDVLTRVAVQDQRLLGIEDDLRDMKHGKGFILGRSNIGDIGPG